MKLELSELNNDQLLQNTSRLVKVEGHITAKILLHMQEIERRRIYSEMGYASMYDMMIKHFGYSGYEAFHRINAMRALYDNPEIADKLTEKKISLSNVAQAHTFIQQQKITDIEQKKEIFEKMEGLSTREVKKTLQAMLPEDAKPVKKSRFEERRHLEQVIDDQTMQNLETLFARFSHKNPNMNFAELIKVLTAIGLKETDPTREKRKSPVRKTESTLGAQGGARNYVTVSLRREIFRRDHSQCSYVDPITKRKCTATHFLEIDHIKPRAMGGGNEPENLRLLCREHNQLMAIRNLGEEKMEAYVGRRRGSYLQ